MRAMSLGWAVVSLVVFISTVCVVAGLGAHAAWVLIVAGWGVIG